MASNDSQRLRRLLRLIHSLSQASDGLSVQDVAVKEGLDEKTIRRDLILLKHTGLPLEERRAKFGRKLWLIRAGIEGVQFNLFELLSLYMGRKLMEPFAGTPFFEGLYSVFSKIEKEVLNESKVGQAELSQMLYFSTAGTSDYSGRTHLITTILQSITKRQALQLTYQKPSASASMQYMIHPYCLAAWHGSLYVVARSVVVGAMRHFKLDRIEGIEILSQKYRIPRNFNVETYFQGTFGIFSPGKDQYRIEIEFCGYASKTVKESRWHTTQRFHDQEDGTTVMHLILNDLQEVKRWVLSFGAHARVLHPPELISIVRQEIAELHRHYS